MADKSKIELPRWAGREILDESHAAELDSRASAHELDSKLPRTQAEEEAYREYVKDHHARAAAHHLMGMKSAQGSGSMDEARKHGAMYGLHIKALGEDSYGPVPARVKQHVDAPDREQIYKFKAHKGDAFLLKDGERDRKPEPSNHAPKGSDHHAEPSEGKDAQNNYHSLDSAESQPRDASRFDLSEKDLDYVEIERKPLPSSKVGEYETKRCDKCKRDTIHQNGVCRACKPTKKAEGKATTAEIKNDGPFIEKSEVDFDRLHTLYKAIKLAEALLQKGDVIQGRFPQHTANPQAQGPAAPVQQLPVRQDLDLAAGRLPPMRANGSRPEGQQSGVRDVLNRFLNNLGGSQPHPTNLVAGKWLHEIKPGNPSCGHDEPQWSESGQVAACPACGGVYGTTAMPKL